MVDDQRELAVTVIGPDRPGIIADVTGVLAGLGLNLADSTMTLLRGHFTMMLICVGAAEAGAVQDAFGPLTADGGLVVAVRAVAAGTESGTDEQPNFMLTVHGADRPGIVAAVTRVIADAGGNITDLSTRLAGDLYVIVAEVDLPTGADPDALSARLADVAAGLGVGAHLRPAEADLL